MRNPVKDNRSMALYILLTMVTCGIYAWVFMYGLINDINTICDGDGDETPGLLMYVLLSVVTCGIYSYFWMYKVADRLANNAPRYGLYFKESGTTVLLWMIFGAFLCGIGPLVAFYIIINNTNCLARAYNVGVMSTKDVYAAPVQPQGQPQPQQNAGYNGQPALLEQNNDIVGYCEQCGTPIARGNNFCDNCGAPVPPNMLNQVNIGR